MRGILLFLRYLEYLLILNYYERKMHHAQFLLRYKVFHYTR